MVVSPGSREHLLIKRVAFYIALNVLLPLYRGSPTDLDAQYTFSKRIAYIGLNVD